jgi:Putative lumazine-binding
MTRFVLPLLVTVLLLPGLAQAQDNSEHEVRAVIDQLFDGMRAGDSTAVRAVFEPGARLVSSGSRPDGTPFMRPSPVDGFVSAVGSPHEEVWDERIWDVQIDVRDNFASALMDFAFYLDDSFLHCGVNHFQFVKGGDGVWRAVALSDTRRPGEECDLDQDKVEASAVETALRNYLRGHATGDGAHHAKVFHPVSNLFWMRDGELNTRTGEAYIAGASGNPAENESERLRFIEWVDVSGEAAVAKIVLDYPGAYIVDYMSLLKVDGRWQIVNKIFQVGD